MARDCDEPRRPKGAGKVAPAGTTSYFAFQGMLAGAEAHGEEEVIASLTASPG